MKKVAISALLLYWLAPMASALPPGVEPRADKILADMSGYLGGLKDFSFHSEVTLEEPVSGLQVEITNGSDIFVHRPDKIRVSRKGDKGHHEAFYDGKLLSLVSPEQRVYAQSEVPASIEPMLDYAHQKLGMTFPLADLLFADSHSVLGEHTESGFYAGEHSVDGVACDHLAFTQASGLEWQIWIEQGAQKLPRKFVIRHFEEPGSPRFQALLSKWDTAPKFPANLFQFETPAGAHKVEMRGNKG